MSARAALVAFALSLAVLLPGCGGGEGSASTASSTHSTSTATPSQARRAEDAGANPSGAPAYNQNLLPFRAAPLSAAQRRELERRGQTSFAVRLGKKPGVLSAFGQTQLGLSIVKVAKAASVTAYAAGTAHLTLRLTPTARRFLARGHSMLMYVAIRFSRSRTAQQLVVPLGPHPPV